ncbi:MAG: hypothetical protein CMB67_04455 [Euryarchaeota archaeon]|nr:hypothetical protein [Euryarchaeota archaeon]
MSSLGIFWKMVDSDDYHVCPSKWTKRGKNKKRRIIERYVLTTNGTIRCGMILNVFWSNYCEWFTGKVINIDSKGCVHIHYTDGDKVWHKNLNQMPWYECNSWLHAGAEFALMQLAGNECVA